MRLLQFAKLHTINSSTTIATVIVVLLFFTSSCSEKSESTEVVSNGADSIAFMSTYDVNTIISDSGRISYKIEAKEWHVYDKRNPPYWAFEKGIYLEKYDDSLRIETTLRSDTAYYYDQMKLWQLFGNVRINSSKGEKIYTNKLFWSSDSGRIYSDSYIKIEQDDRITEGIGFSSNQDFTVWEILNTTGIYPIEEK